MAEEQDIKQICSIRIAFPVETDEEAIVYKKKIAEILASVKKARIEFSILAAPSLTAPL